MRNGTIFLEHGAFLCFEVSRVRVPAYMRLPRWSHQAVTGEKGREPKQCVNLCFEVKYRHYGKKALRLFDTLLRHSFQV